MTLIDVRFCFIRGKRERANRNWYSKSFSRSFLLIKAEKTPPKHGFHLKMLFFLIETDVP